MKHEHKFRKSGMTIWCACGETRDITCAHDWKLHKKEMISIQQMGGEARQEQETHICKGCGAVANINTTAGTTRITR